MGTLFHVAPFTGYVYPNEATQQPLWSVLIVLYPYITGLVAGAFIMASLVRVFNVRALEPVYRLSLLTAFAFLLCAPLPLLFHLGHPELSARYNPVGSFSRITEVATRIAGQLPSQGQSAAFKEFVWRFVNVMAWVRRCKTCACCSR